MAGMLNIPSHNTDPNYRYRMPRLVSKVEGRGNGIKTNIMNMADIARSLKRPPEYPTKFCGTELGAQSKFDAAEGKSIINGAHEVRDLQQLIDKFVDKYVLCPNCALPEIDLVVKKGIVGCHCNACGHNGDLDNSHRLATFVVRNPPKAADSTMGKGKTKAERREKKLKAAAAGGGDEAVDAAAAGAEEKGKKAKKKKKDKTTEKAKGSKKRVDGDDDDGEGDDGEDGGGESSSAPGPDENGVGVGQNGATAHGADAPEASAKKSKKAKKKGVGVGPLLFKDSLSYDSPEIADVRDRLLAFLGKGPCSQASSSAPVVSPEQFFLELRKLQVSQDFDSVLRLFVALDVLLYRSVDSSEEQQEDTRVVVTADMVEENISYLRTVVDTSIDTAGVCVAVEDFVALRGKQPESMENFPFIIHKLFLHELVEEEALIERYREEPPQEEAKPTKGSKKAAAKASKAGAQGQVNKEAAKAVQPFIKWLEEGEEESEEESGSEAAAPAAPSGQQTAAQRAQATASSASPLTGNTDAATTEPCASNEPNGIAANSEAKADEEEDDSSDDDDDELDIDAI